MTDPKNYLVALLAVALVAVITSRLTEPVSAQSPLNYQLVADAKGAMWRMENLTGAMMYCYRAEHLSCELRGGGRAAAITSRPLTAPAPELAVDAGSILPRSAV